MHPAVKVLHTGLPMIEKRLKPFYRKKPSATLIIFDANQPAKSTYITSIQDNFRIRLTLADAADIICEFPDLDRIATTDNDDTMKHSDQMLTALRKLVVTTQMLTQSTQWLTIMRLRRTQAVPTKGIHPVRPAVIALVPSQRHKCGDLVGLIYRHGCSAIEAAAALAVAAARARIKPPPSVQLQP